MDKIKSFLKGFNSSFIFGLGLIISGLILVILPGSALTTVCTILGIGVGVKGALKLIACLKAKQVEAERNTDLISAIVILLAAFVLIAHPRRLLSIIPMLIGIGIIVYGASSFFKAHTLFSKITSVVIFIVGIGIVSSPFAFAEVVTFVLGAALLIVGIITVIKSKNTATLKIEDKPDDGYTEVDFRDID